MDSAPEPEKKPAKSEKTADAPKRAPPSLPQKVRQLVWNHHMGEDRGRGPCRCCFVTTITAFDFEAGHVQSRACGGSDAVANLLPICSLCNRSMGTKNLRDFQAEHGFREPRSGFYYWAAWLFGKT